MKSPIESESLAMGFSPEAADLLALFAQATKRVRRRVALRVIHVAALPAHHDHAPLHPMYAGDRSAINTLAQANDLAESLASPHVGAGGR